MILVLSLAVICSRSVSADARDDAITARENAEAEASDTGLWFEDAIGAGQTADSFQAYAWTSYIFWSGEHGTSATIEAALFNGDEEIDDGDDHMDEGETLFDAGDSHFGEGQTAFDNEQFVAAKEDFDNAAIAYALASGKYELAVDAFDDAVEWYDHALDLMAPP